MLIDTKNYYTHLTADKGMILSNGKVLAKEVFIPSSANADEWNEVSEFVLMTPEEQQNRITELENQVTDYENKWNNLDVVKARFNALGKLIKDTQPIGDYLNPIKFTDNLEVEQGKFYSLDDPDNPAEPFIWEAKKSGTPSSANDSEYFNIVY